MKKTSNRHEASYHFYLEKLDIEIEVTFSRIAISPFPAILLSRSDHYYQIMFDFLNCFTEISRRR